MVPNCAGDATGHALADDVVGRMWAQDRSQPCGSVRLNDTEHNGIGEGQAAATLIKGSVAGDAERIGEQKKAGNDLGGGGRRGGCVGQEQMGAMSCHRLSVSTSNAPRPGLGFVDTDRGIPHPWTTVTKLFR